MESHKKLVKKTGTFSQIRLYSNCEVWYNKKRSGAVSTTSLIQIINVLNLSPKTFKTTSDTRKIIA